MQSGEKISLATMDTSLLVPRGIRAWFQNPEATPAVVRLDLPAEMYSFSTVDLSAVLIEKGTDQMVNDYVNLEPEAQKIQRLALEQEVATEHDRLILALAAFESVPEQEVTILNFIRLANIGVHHRDLLFIDHVNQFFRKHGFGRVNLPKRLL